MSDHETPLSPEAMRDRNRRVFEGLSSPPPFKDVLTKPSRKEFIATMKRYEFLNGLPMSFLLWYYPDPDIADYHRPETRSFGIYHAYDIVYGRSQPIALAGIGLNEYQKVARRMRGRNHPIITLLPEDIQPDFLRERE